MGRIHSQIIRVEGERYAIPQENLKELVRIPAAEIKNKIDKVGNMPVIRLRQEFLPLFDLTQVLNIQKTYSTANGGTAVDRRLHLADRRSVQHLTSSSHSAEKSEDTFTKRQKEDRRTSAASAVSIAIVYSGQYQYGLVVDKFHDSEEIDILDIGRYLRPSGIYVGTTILKDKSASLILDIPNIACKLGMRDISESVNDAVPEAVINEDSSHENTSLLIFKNSDNEYFAVDLESVERLERFKSSNFEKVGNEEVVQYRDGALTLFELSNVLECSQFIASEFQEVIVFKHENTLAGLKVVPPIDTTQCRFCVDDSVFNSPPVLGSMIINGKTTLILDVPAMVKASKRRYAS